MFGVFFHFVTLNHPSFGNVLNMHLYEGHNEIMVKLNIKHPYISHMHVDSLKKTETGPHMSSVTLVEPM